MTGGKRVERLVRNFAETKIVGEMGLQLIPDDSNKNRRNIKRQAARLSTVRLRLLRWTAAEVLPASYAKSTLLVPQQPGNSDYVRGLGFVPSVRRHFRHEQPRWLIYARLDAGVGGTRTRHSKGNPNVEFSRGIPHRLTTICRRD